MSTPNFSSFISNFSGTTPIDIISVVSDASNVYTTTGNTYYARYFYLGNLLIQFNDFGGGIPPDLDNGSYTIYFPKVFSDNPYTIIVSQTSNDYSNVTTTVTSLTKVNFSVAIGNNNKGSFSFLAIGPRPDLYT